MSQSIPIKSMISNLRYLAQEMDPDDYMGLGKATLTQAADCLEALTREKPPEYAAVLAKRLDITADFLIAYDAISSAMACQEARDYLRSLPTLTRAKEVPEGSVSAMLAISLGETGHGAAIVSKGYASLNLAMIVARDIARVRPVYECFAKVIVPPIVKPEIPTIPATVEEVEG